jgi:hypothetical protein
MKLQQEVFLAVLTISPTFILSDFAVELVSGVTIYTCSRLFYKYFGEKTSNFINKIIEKCKKTKN